ncbi:MAG: MFS transporter [Clostridia bacterium]
MSYRALARGPYFRAWSAMLLTNLGTNIGWLAIIWLAAERGGAGAVGILTAAFALPGVVSGVYAGVVLDRFPRAIGIALDNGGRAILYGVAAVLASEPHLPLVGMTVLVGLGSLLTPLSQAGIWSLVPDLLGKGQTLGSANAAMNAIWQVATLAGPALGGVLTARFGPVLPISLQAASYAVTALVMIPLRRIHTAPAEVVSTWAGLRVVFRTPAVLAVTFFTFAYAFVYAPLEVGLPGFVSHELHGTAGSYGLLWAIFAIGALAGSFIWGTRRGLPRLGWWLAADFLAWGLVMVGFSQTRIVAAALVVMALGGFVYSPYQLWTNTYLQQSVPGNLLGRLFGAFTAITGLGLPLGSLAAGAASTTISLPTLIAAGGIACLGLGVLAILQPSIRGLPDLNLAAEPLRPDTDNAPS